MPEMAHAGEHHRNPGAVGGFNHFLIAHGAAWLADRDEKGVAWATRDSFVPDVWERASQQVRHGRQAFSAEETVASSMERKLRAIDANLALFAPPLRHELVK